MVTSDQGSEFNNSVNRELMGLLNIDYRLTTPYHPQVSTIIPFKICIVCMHVIYQANGLIERFNQTIQAMLVIKRTLGRITSIHVSMHNITLPHMSPLNLHSLNLCLGDATLPENIESIITR